MVWHTPELVSGVGMTSQRTRNRMVERLAQAGIRDESVLDVMAQAPRHLFLDEALSHRAYEDTSLPLGLGQTLSQPWIVARMSELVMQESPQKVLEIGTGSGYQTLVLSQLIESVYSVERIAALLDKANARLGQLGVTNVMFRHADGGLGWDFNAPFDVILLTACAPQIPQTLLSQLRDGGVLIAPVANDNGKQWLTRIRRNGSSFINQKLEAVRFVPLLEGVIG